MIPSQAISSPNHLLWSGQFRYCLKTVPEKYIKSFPPGGAPSYTYFFAFKVRHSGVQPMGEAFGRTYPPIKGAFDECDISRLSLGKTSELESCLARDTCACECDHGLMFN